ncbi:hypothetical protein AB0C81_03415 [Streptomyces roseoverticillatus]|uniref:hypothetical protein n=1 Tax=Streptomyces roseoverticillatus TaxID=66429 RepID=UPI0033CA1688
MNTSPQQPSAPDAGSAASSPAPPPYPPAGPGPSAAPRRLWIPVLAGAVAASVFWGGFLALMDGPRSAATDTRGYRVSTDLCKDASTEALGSLFTVKDDDDRPGAVLRHDAMDRSECYRDLEPKKGRGGMVTLNTMVTLHKQSDRTPEFIAEAESAGYIPGSKATVKKVTDLGDRAYLASVDVDKTIRMTTLSVLDGGAEYWVKVTQSSSDEAPAYDADQLQPLLVKDAKATIAELKS